MRHGLAVLVLGLFGCSQAGSTSDEAPVSPSQPGPDATVEPVVEPTPEPTPEPVAVAEPVAQPDPEPVADPQGGKIEVQMLSATLADDCGSGPTARPVLGSKAKHTSVAAEADEVKGAKAKAKAERRCEQSSIQLAITAPADAKAATLEIKSVELLLASGSTVGTLQARAPSVWSDAGGYAPWDETIEPARELAVSYALSQPDWSKVKDRWNQAYTVKAVLSVAGTEETVEHDVVVDAPTSLPPGVKT